MLLVLGRADDCRSLDKLSEAALHASRRQSTGGGAQPFEPKSTAPRRSPISRTVGLISKHVVFKRLKHRTAAATGVFNEVAEAPGPASARIIELVKGEFPLVPILARAFDREHAIELLAAGAEYHVRETFESALVMGREALARLGTGHGELLETMREMKFDRTSAFQNRPTRICPRKAPSLRSKNIPLWHMKPCNIPSPLRGAGHIHSGSSSRPSNTLCLLAIIESQS